MKRQQKTLFIDISLKFGAKKCVGNDQPNTKMEIMQKLKCKQLYSKYVIVSQSNDNCLQIQYLIAILELKDKDIEVQAL